MFSWIVLGARTYESFSGFFALWFIGWGEFGLQKLTALSSANFDHLLAKIEKVVRVNEYLGAVGYVGQAAAFKKKQCCSDDLTSFDRRTQDARQFRPQTSFN